MCRLDPVIKMFIIFCGVLDFKHYYDIQPDGCVQVAGVTSVGDELCCSAGVLIVAVRPCQPTPPPAALVEGKGAN